MCVLYDNKKVKLFLLIIIILVLGSLLSSVVFADIASSMKGAASGAKAGLSKLFHFDINKPGFLDFTLFFIIFLALAWLGFSRWFEQQQNSGRYAIIGLAVGMALAFALALVYGAKFGIGKLVPFAIVLVAIGALVLLYFIISRIMNAQSVGRRILAFIISLIVLAILLALFFIFVADEGLCEKNKFLKRLCGSESLLGKLGAGGKGGSSSSSTNSSISSINKSGPPGGGGSGAGGSGSTNKSAPKIPVSIKSEVTNLSIKVSVLEAELNAAIRAKDTDKILKVRKELNAVSKRLADIIASVKRIK